MHAKLESFVLVKVHKADPNSFSKQIGIKRGKKLKKTMESYEQL